MGRKAYGPRLLRMSLEISRGKDALLPRVAVLGGFERRLLRKKADSSGKQNQYPTASGEVRTRPGSED